MVCGDVGVRVAGPAASVGRRTRTASCTRLLIDADLEEIAREQSVCVAGRGADVGSCEAAAKSRRKCTTAATAPHSLTTLCTRIRLPSGRGGLARPPPCSCRWESCWAAAAARSTPPESRTPARGDADAGGEGCWFTSSTVTSVKRLSWNRLQPKRPISCSTRGRPDVDPRLSCVCAAEVGAELGPAAAAVLLLLPPLLLLYSRALVNGAHTQCVLLREPPRCDCNASFLRPWGSRQPLGRRQ